MFQTIGIICDDNSRHVRTFYAQNFNAACERIYVLYPNWVSILGNMKEDEIEPFLRVEEEV